MALTYGSSHCFSARQYRFLPFVAVKLKSLVLLCCCYFCLSMFFFEKIHYMFDQVNYGVRLMLTRQPIDRVISDPHYQHYHDKLQQLDRIKQFASLYGLHTDSYTHMVFPSGDPEVVSYLVVAAEKLRLQAIEEWFPFVGRVHYLGYFRESDRDRKAKELAEHYDVYLGRASAFSLLGYLSDPLFPSMLKGSTGDVADLLLHELVHGTIWVRDQLDFNEHLATFISKKLTKLYLIKHGMTDEVTRMSVRASDQKLYQDWLSRLKEALVSLYDDDQLSDQQKIQKKNNIISDFVAEKPKGKKYDYVGAKSGWNNARLILANTYSPNLQIFEDTLKCSLSDDLSEQIKDFIITLKTAQQSLEKLANTETKVGGKEILQEVCRRMEQE
ncbi:MAG: aminopeptidase [Proteobacteria bacterium]|nr:aminopeptidase [Pseudomonadota bacterium]